MENETNDNEKSAHDHGKQKSKLESRFVNEKGFPVTKDGVQILCDIMNGSDARCPDLFDSYIYNDFHGYGVMEVIENQLIGFNKILYQKDVSPIKKWSLVEGIASWYIIGDIGELTCSDRAEDIAEVIQMFIPLLTHGLYALAEHDLLDVNSSPVPNASIVTVIFLDLLTDACCDFGLKGVEEILRVADELKLELTPREEVSVSQEKIDMLRECLSETPKPKKLDWKTEWKKFKPNHPGGSKYDIRKMSKAEKKRYSLDNEMPVW